MAERSPVLSEKILTQSLVLVVLVLVAGAASAPSAFRPTLGSMQNLKVVALVSGGKDSTMNMLRCVEQGHEIVCLGNLFPAPAAHTDELDSFMYQTVGHDGIEAIAACMELPLFRRPIQPKGAVNQELEYTPTAGDEVEDLFALLHYVKQQHPGVNAVATGAILSNYQRTRVEAVCMRLGLVSLAFLWQCDQTELLDEMIAAGVEARLIKVACMGLSPQKHLGMTLEQARGTLHRLNAEYGAHVCGEASSTPPPPPPRRKIIVR